MDPAPTGRLRAEARETIRAVAGCSVRCLAGCAVGVGGRRFRAAVCGGVGGREMAQVQGGRAGAGGWWEVTYWPRFFDRNQAITALTVTELLESGRDISDPVVASLRDELR